jgi:hypothetical protein
MTKRPLLLPIAVLLAILVIGCNAKKPGDLPKLYPCTVKIVDKSGTPVEEASVIATRPESKWASIGLTDTEGIAIMKTNGIYPGVPVGTYKIIVTKYDVKGTEYKAVETLIFDKSFSEESTTPLQLTMEAKGNDVTFTVF